MDLHQTVQDLAEAWVAASTDTSFSRTQLQVYGSQEDTEGGGEPSTSSDIDYHNNPVTSSSCGMALQGGDGLPHSHSRKRKQSSPQPRREGGDPIPSSASKSDPPPAKKVTSKESEGKLLPVHCIVELLDTPPGSSKDKDKEKEKQKTEGYAIVPSSLQLRELVRVALSKLEYPAEKARNATGVIQVRNWKPLPFSAVSDNQQSTVGQLFGDLLSHITLKISILSSEDETQREWTDQAVRCTVIELLKEFNQSKLAHISPLSQSMISYIANSKYKASISSEKCEEFGKWYHEFKLRRLKSPEQIMETSNHKVTFHPMHEVPLLRGWYQESQHPPDALLQQYCDILNRCAVRIERKRPVELMHLKNWWKNERAKHKKQAQREQDESVMTMLNIKLEN